MAMLVRPKKKAYFDRKRLPVVYRNKPLMPIRLGRANKLVRLHKAKFKFNSKLGVRYLELTVKPSGFSTQEIVLGVDLGSQFDGFSLVSRYNHHENLELIHPEKYNNPYVGFKSGYKSGSISANLARSRGETRVRRGRLWNRPARYDSRTRSKFAPTFRSMYNFRTWLVKELTKLYPISKVVMEFVAYHYPKRSDFNSEVKFLEAVRFGRAHFTCVMAGQRRFKEFLRSVPGVTSVKTRKGYVTARLRRENFSYLGVDPKTSNKAAKSFYAHNVDSFSLAMLDFSLEDRLNLSDPKNLNTKVRALEKIRFIEGNNPGGKRKLTMLKSRHGEAKYYRIARPKGYVTKNPYNIVKLLNDGGKLRNYELLGRPLGKESICRIQVAPKNFKDFTFISNGRAEKSKKYIRDNSTVTVPKLVSTYHSNGKLRFPKPTGANSGLAQKLWKQRRPKLSTGVSRYARYNGLFGDKRSNSFGRCREICNSLRKGEDKFTLIEFRHQTLAIWR